MARRKPTIAAVLITLLAVGAQEARAAECDDPATDFDFASSQVQGWGASVARVRVIEGVGYCTATLIAPDLAITAGHCFDPSKNTLFGQGASQQTMCDGTTLQFGYENIGGVLNTGGPEYDCVEILDQAFIAFPNSGFTDVAVVRVQGNPGHVHGVRPYNIAFPFGSAEDLTLIHHQGGGKKLVSTNDEHQEVTFQGRRFVRHFASTDNGSSGAAILDSDGAIVAVHSGPLSFLEDCSEGNHGYPVGQYREDAHADPSKEVSGGVRWVERAGGPVASDAFGLAVVAGDLNGDGADDLVVHRRSGLVGQSGGLTVFFGVPGFGLDLDGSMDLYQAAGSGAEDGDLFGSVLAVADMNGDGFDELVAATPDEDWNSIDQSGHVVVYRGSPFGPAPFPQGLWPSHWGVALQAGSRFGHAIAAGDFNCDGLDDLAIGAPGTDDNRGRVYVALANGGGQVTPHVTWDAFELGTAQSAGPHWFGHALAAGHLAGSAPPSFGACDELAIGAPLDSAQGLLGTGTVAVVYGNSAGLGWPYAMLRFPVQPQAFGLFGATLATGRLFDGPWDSLAVGSPWQGGAASAVGRVDLYPGGWSMSTDPMTILETMAQGTVDPSSWDNFGDAMAFARTSGVRDELVIAAPGYDQPGANNGGFTMAVTGTGAATIDATPLVDPHGLSLSASDAYGSAIAAGDFDGDGFEELAIAAPWADIDGVTNAGGVIVRHLSL